MKILKFLIPAIILSGLVLILVLLYRNGNMTTLTPQESVSTPVEEVNAPKATGDIDTSISALEAYSEGEYNQLSTENQEVSLVDSDTGYFDGYLNAYVEGEI